jgi:capsular exopolysaccharide synthesis family protein
LSEAERQRLDSLLSRLPELRYARLDVQSRLADAQYSLSSLSSDDEKPIDTAVVVDEALFPTKPLSRKHLQKSVLAAIVGFMIGAGISMLLEYIDYTIKSPEVLDAVYGMATQGVIRSLTGKERKYKEGYLVALDNTRSPTAEAFRSLRTGIQVARLNASIRSLLVTSAGPGEGKTFVAANLAVSLALNGYRVILVDTDLRRPTLHTIFDLPRDKGFTNLVMNQDTSLDDVLHQTKIENLRVLLCGPIPPYPSELLSSMQADQTMRKLEEDADIVIYDSPPVATVTDAALLAQRADGVLQVVWAGHTRINLVQRSKAILEHVGARILGPVLNQVQDDDLGYSSYYYNYGYYGDGERSKKGSGLRLPFLSRRQQSDGAEPPDAISPLSPSRTEERNGSGQGERRRGKAERARRSGAEPGKDE